MNVSPLLKSQIYYPLLLMKMDGTELDKGCEITKTGVIWEREPVSALFTRFTWNRKLLKYAALSLSLVLLKTVKKSSHSWNY